MSTDEIIHIDADDATGRPVIVNCAAGSTVTINVNVRIHNYYGWPDWMDLATATSISDTIRRRGDE